MDGYYIFLILITVFASVIFLVEWVVEGKWHLKILAPIFFVLLFLWLLPKICYVGLESTEKEIEVTKLNGAYIAEVNGKIVNLNHELCMNFSEKSKFYVKTEVNKYKIFGDFKTEKVFVKEE